MLYVFFRHKMRSLALRSWLLAILCGFILMTMQAGLRTSKSCSHRGDCVAVDERCTVADARLGQPSSGICVDEEFLG